MNKLNGRRLSLAAKLDVNGSSRRQIWSTGPSRKQMDHMRFSGGWKEDKSYTGQRRVNLIPNFGLLKPAAYFCGHAEADTPWKTQT